MAKIKVNQLKEGEEYWTPKFYEITREFEPSLEKCCFGDWGTFADGWGFDNQEECTALCIKLNKAISVFKRENLRE